MESINEGRPAVLGKKSIFASDVREMAADLTGINPQPKPKSRLGKLLAGVRE
jgi:hypothetical protein